MKLETGDGRPAHLIAFVAIVLVLVWPVTAVGETRAPLTPALHAGEILRYDVRGRIQRHVKEQSRVGTITTPGDIKEEFSGVLTVTIQEARLENGRPVVDAQAEFGVTSNEPGATAAKENHKLDFTIGANGQLLRETGLEDLEPLERLAWQFWIARFAFGWTVPASKAKPGDKWKSEEPENHPVPIAHLMWERETTYGEDGKCPTASAEACAAFYTNAVLRQRSSPTDSTPEDYKLHDLKTSGTATGSNEIYTVISLQSGLAVRAREDVQQSMNVVIVKPNASNAVKYVVDASSHFEMLLADGAH